MARAGGGDRLGHALALTIDPVAWAHERVVVQQPLGERLLDLAWLLGILRGAWLGDAHVRSAATFPADAEPRLAQTWRDGLATAGIHDPVDPVAFHRGFSDPVLLRDWIDIGPSGDPLQRLFATACQRPGSPTHPEDADILFDTIPVQTQVDTELLVAIRHRLTADIVRRQLAIEVNPTSNLVVGALRHPFDQPMLHLHPLQSRRTQGPHAELPVMPVALHADDPLTFATCLGDEFAYAWAGMVVAGNADPQHARAWLDEAASVSWRWRFTRA